jgi:pimeloyl-ACP methyl ester carboxylesterase
MSHTHVTAPTQFVEAKGIRFAYRQFGKQGGVPLVFMQHFRGGLDHWDPVITDGLGRDRPVILFDNAGVAASSGDTPETIEAMAEDAIAFVRALSLTQIDLLGFSIGGYVAQAFTFQEPGLVRRLMLLGTGPRGREP